MGSASIYRAQPRKHAPWEGAKNPDAIFIPGLLSIGSDNHGGYCDRPFATCVPVGKSWRAPAVRIGVGKSAAESLKAYCEANGINRRLEEEKFDLIFVFSSGMAQFVPRDPGVFKIIDFADVDSDKWFQYSKFVKAPLSHVYRLEGEKLRRYEVSLAPLYDRCTVISEAEERLFRSYSDRFVLCTVPNGVDVEYFQAETRVPHQQSLIFMGVMDYYANVDGVLYFTHHILPLIQKAIPQVKFTILGGNPTRAIRRLARVKT